MGAASLDVRLAAILVILTVPLFIGSASAANTNLFVSAENSRFDDHFAGSMIVEVIVRDPDISGVGSPIGEPNVTINGNDLRMVQATDGAWYAYFAHIDGAQAADQAVADAGAQGDSLDFGVFCGADTDVAVLGADFTDSQGVAVPRTGELEGFANGDAALGACTGNATSTQVINGVLRQPKQINENPRIATGQIGLDADVWPIIQLFSFGNVEIKYDRAGGSQQVNLEYSEIPNITLELDREQYPPGAEVFVTIFDAQLNQDPTDEDSWTFDVGSQAVFYNAFTESGADAGNGGTGLVNLNPHLSSIGFEDNGRVSIDLGSVLELRTNRHQPESSVTDGSTAYRQIVTFVETRSNSGEFRSYDTASVSVIGMLSDAPRGMAGSIRYNDGTQSIFSGVSSASFLPDSGVPAPGKRIPVTITDDDQNVNSARRDSLDVFRASAIIPILSLGAPLTLQDASDVRFYESSGEWTSVASRVLPDFSGRLAIDSASVSGLDFETITIDAGYTAGMLRSLFVDSGGTSAGTNWINYDLRSIRNLGVDFSDASISLAFGAADDSPIEVARIASSQGFLAIDDAVVDSVGLQSGGVHIVIDLDASGDSQVVGRTGGDAGLMPVIVDFFSFGIEGPREVNNAIYRFELEETQRNSGVFAGSVEYVVANQLNIADPGFISTLDTIGDDIRLIVAGERLDEDALVISYADLDVASVSEKRSEKHDVRTHTGKVSTDAASYGFGRPVTIILDDPDLNLDYQTIETYRVINNPNLPGVDTVGNDDGSILLEVSIKGFRYMRCMIDGVAHGGLAATGFTMSETGTDTGIFEGVFKMPSQICSEDGTGLVSPAGGSIDVRYYDFRDSSGNTNISKLSSPKNAQSTVRLNAYEFSIPKYNGSVEIILSGELSRHSRGIPVSVILYDPLGASDTFGVLPTGSGAYSMPIILHHDSPVGTYLIDIMYDGEHAGSASFVLSPRPEPPADPVRQQEVAPPKALPETPGEPVMGNNTKWRDGDAMTDSELLDGIGQLIDEKPAEMWQYNSTGLPDWVKSGAEWWGEGLITDDEFAAILQFLVKKGIIQV